jgi:predicted DNA-binding protein (MmcQ/YjbR family)
MAKKQTLEEACENLFKAALAYPGAYEENPWGERVAKVNGKVFLFSGMWKGNMNFSVKLPQSKEEALSRPHATPTGYGLGKSGWVSFSIPTVAEIPKEAEAWLEESYRTVAPKKLSKLIGTAEAAPAPKKKAARKSVTLSLLGADQARLKRAVESLSQHGFDVKSGTLDDDSIASVVERAPRVVVIDLGRLASEALEIVAILRQEIPKSAIVLSGVRDAAMERKAKKLEGLAGTSRLPPGDPAFAGELEQLLT